MENSNNLSFLGILSCNCPAYSCDAGTGRCRMTGSDLLKFKVSIGHILVLKITDRFSSSSIQCICTAYPDTKRQLVDGNISFDDSVCNFKRYSTTGSNEFGEVIVHIINILPQKSCRSFSLNQTNQKSIPLSSNFIGLTVHAGFHIRINSLGTIFYVELV